MKTVLVTGASRGIGHAVASAFLDQNDMVFVCCHSSLESMKDLTQRGALPFLADVSKEEEVKALFDFIYQKTTHLDVLVNNAGISIVGLIQDLSVSDFDRLMAVNLRSAFLCCKAAIPCMIHQKKGCIINISSMWGDKGASCEAAYSASKGGLNGLTRALAKELAPSGIRVNAIACGAIDTEMNSFLSAQERADLEESIGMGRFGKPSEVADLVLYLSSDKSSYLTGDVITLDGSF